MSIMEIRRGSLLLGTLAVVLLAGCNIPDIDSGPTAQTPSTVPDITTEAPAFVEAAPITLIAPPVDLPTPAVTPDLTAIPASLTLTGRVIDSQGVPIDNIGIAILHGNDRLDTRSDGNGMFEVTVPYAGVWNVQIISVGCTSRIVDDTCTIRGYFALNDSQYIELPRTRSIEFVYEQATQTISGRVVDSQGNPVRDVRVWGLRDDGAKAWLTSNEYGEFVLPTSPGQWELYTVTFNPYAEGTHIRVTVPQDAGPAPVDVPMPYTEPPPVVENLTLSGQVRDSLGVPIESIGIAILHGSDRLDAQSDSTGAFEVTVPYAGVWNAQIISVGCTSRIVDDNCTIRGYFEVNGSQYIEIPGTNTVEFIYEQTDYTISGRVVDVAGNPVGNVRVFGLRDDGAKAWLASDEYGEFTLPVSPGQWELYTVTFNPYVEGIHIPVSIAANAIHDTVDLPIP